MFKFCAWATVQDRMASKLSIFHFLRSFCHLADGVMPELGNNNSSLDGRRKQASHERLLVNCTVTLCRNAQFQTKENSWFH